MTSLIEQRPDQSIVLVVFLLVSVPAFSPLDYPCLAVLGDDVLWEAIKVEKIINDWKFPYQLVLVIIYIQVYGERSK